MKINPTSLVDIIQSRAKYQPQRLAYRFLVDGEDEEEVMNYEELDRRARSVGALLQSSLKAGDRALLFFQPGLDFITTYLGCLYAGVIAVPSYPPHSARLHISLPGIRRMAADAGAAAILLNKPLFDAIHARNDIQSEFGSIKLLVTGVHEIEQLAAHYRRPAIAGNDLAFLQYTSGSTSIPRGVMISHSNLMHNMSVIEKYFDVTEKTHSVIWLPPYHDMGLIGGILQPLYSGFPVTLMPHLTFLQRPFRWLQAMSRFRATISAAPNFAYDLCIRKITPQQLQLLDLSHWKSAFVGAEPVYHKTLDKFADYFSQCGFRREAFVPCYGLAESTLLVCAKPKDLLPTIRHFQQQKAIENKIAVSTEKSEESQQTLVSCGNISSGQILKIVNPNTHVQCKPEEEGEIWIKGPSVAGGYWNNTAETIATFNAQLSDNSETHFLRTGDLGFICEGELYVTGRLKDLIISEGKNYSPYDIERSVEASNPDICPLSCAAFSIINDGHEVVIIVAEVTSKIFVNEEEIINSIRTTVSLNHGLHVHVVKLTKPGSIPRTTSGKIIRFRCREQYSSGLFKEIETT